MITTKTHGFGLVCRVLEAAYHGRPDVQHRRFHAPDAIPFEDSLLAAHRPVSPIGINQKSRIRRSLHAEAFRRLLSDSVTLPPVIAPPECRLRLVPGARKGHRLRRRRRVVGNA